MKPLILVLFALLLVEGCSSESGSRSEEDFQADVCRPISKAIDAGKNGASAQAEWDAQVSKAVAASAKYLDAYPHSHDAHVLSEVSSVFETMTLGQVTPNQAAQATALEPDLGAICGVK